MALTESAPTTSYPQEYAGRRVLEVSISLVLLAAISIILRVTARNLTRKPLWYDDWFIVVALLCCIGILILSSSNVANGLGYHADKAGTTVFPILLKALFGTELLYIWAMTFSKLSILGYFLRIFHFNAIRQPTFLTAGIVGCWGISLTLATIFQCTPVESAFELSVGGKCISRSSLFYANFLPNIVTDLLLIIIPLLYINRLRVNMVNKLFVFGILLLGIFLIAASTFRLQDLLSIDYSSVDLSWDLVGPTIWTVVETNVVVILACLLTLRPIVNFLQGKPVNARAARKSVSSGTRSWGGTSTLEDTQRRYQKPWFGHVRSPSESFEQLREHRGSSMEQPETAILDRKDRWRRGSGNGNAQKRTAEEEEDSNEWLDNNVPMKDLGGIAVERDFDVEYHGVDRKVG